ncbi:MAG: type II secretion system F family protein [Pelagibacterales bacterium]|nr:type II secretion system F family protein [Pelagibacterales bacterium]
MKLFTYKAMDKSGLVIIDTINAKNLNEVENEIEKRKLIAIKISERKKISTIFSNKKKILNLKQTSEFISNFSMMIETGMTIKNSLEALQESLKDRAILELVENILTNLVRGDSLSQSISKSSPTLSEELISMIDSAETNGNLELILSNMNLYLERKNKFQQKMTNALIYPFFLFMVTIIVLNIIFTQVIPQFAMTFEDANAELPSITKILFNISNFLQNSGMKVAFGFLITIFIFILLRQSSSFRYSMSSFLLKAPYLGKLITHANLSRFAHQVYINLLSGLQLDLSISLANNSISNLKIKSDLAIVPQQIRKGNPLSQSLKDIDAFPDYLISMISAGEETGSLITVFDKISNHLDMQLENSLERLNKLIEPIIIVFVGVVVSIIAFAILSPILSLNEFV